MSRVLRGVNEMEDEIYILEDKPVHVSFANDFDAFFKGGRGILGTPLEAFLRLIGVQGDRKIEIEKIDDLKGKVSITTPDEALEFVRLFSSFDTHYLFKEMQYVEPTPTDYQTHQLKPPQVAPQGNGFLIERNLVDKAGRLLRSKEYTGKDGTYSLLSSDVIDEHSPVHYPLYQ